MKTVAERNIDAEVRGVEEGHRAFVQDDGSIEVISDTHHEKQYRVTYRASTIDGLVSFECKPKGNRCYKDDHLATSPRPGLVGCKHAAIAARRLEREGLITLFEGIWFVTEDVLAIERARIAAMLPADPFEGLGMRG